MVRGWGWQKVQQGIINLASFRRGAVLGQALYLGLLCPCPCCNSSVTSDSLPPSGRIAEGLALRRKVQKRDVCLGRKSHRLM